MSGIPVNKSSKIEGTERLQITLENLLENLLPLSFSLCKVGGGPDFTPCFRLKTGSDAVKHLLEHLSCTSF
jgi:hypothetical protein